MFIASLLSSSNSFWHITEHGCFLPDNVKKLAEDTCKKLENILGTQNFVQVYNLIRKNLKLKRNKRRQEEKLMAVINPMRNAKRKLRITAKNRANKKRKITTIKMGRWMRWLKGGVRRNVHISVPLVWHCECSCIEVFVKSLILPWTKILLEIISFAKKLRCEMPSYECSIYAGFSGINEAMSMSPGCLKKNGGFVEFSS